MKNRKALIFIIISCLVVFSSIKFLRQSQKTAIAYSDNTYAAHVIDGDTVELGNGQKVRYIGIDTPELRDSDNGKWTYNPKPYAEEAKDFNRKLVEGKNIRLEFDIQKKDKYDRFLAYVYVDNMMVNLEMIKKGYAMVYTIPPNVKHLEEFLEAQKQARSECEGIWYDLENNIIPAFEAEKYMGVYKAVTAEIIDTYMSERVLVLKCKNNFNIVIFKNNLAYFPAMAARSPDTYFKGKAVRVYGVIDKYKTSYEIILQDSSQMELIK